MFTWYQQYDIYYTLNTYSYTLGDFHTLTSVSAAYFKILCNRQLLTNTKLKPPRIACYEVLMSVILKACPVGTCDHYHNTDTRTQWYISGK